MEHSKNDECVACTAGVNTHSGVPGSLCSDQNRRPQEIQKWPCWPTPSLVLVIFPGTWTHLWLTQIQYTYTFIYFMATIQSKPLKKSLKTKVNTQELKGAVCLLPPAHRSQKTWSVWIFCLLILKVDHIVQVCDRINSRFSLVLDWNKQLRQNWESLFGICLKKLRKLDG